MALVFGSNAGVLLQICSATRMLRVCKPGGALGARDAGTRPPTCPPSLPRRAVLQGLHL